LQNIFSPGSPHPKNQKNSSAAGSNKFGHDFLGNHDEAGVDNFQSPPPKYKPVTERESYRNNYNSRKISENSGVSPEIDNISGSSFHNSGNKTGRKGHVNNFRATKQNFDASEIKLSTKLRLDKDSIASQYISSR
jgi:hypothetical protein